MEWKLSGYFNLAPECEVALYGFRAKKAVNGRRWNRWEWGVSI